MKPELVEQLVCPRCRCPLQLLTHELEGAEVVQGELRCRGCAQAYPVDAGVPRFVERGAYAGSFGRQWNWFRTVQIDALNGSDESARAFAASTGWDGGDLRGRRVLDAGVGAGRFADVASSLGAEVFGVDLTRAVDAAYANVGRRPGVHLVQADIFALPFRRESFDLAYSIGVLHHTPDTRAAFEQVASMVRPGGGLAVYLYAAYGPGSRGSDLIRKLTTRLPLTAMLALSALAVPAYPVYRAPLLGKLLQLLLPISLHRGWRWRWLDTFDWYTPRYQWKFLYPEIHRWYRSCGFGDMEIFDGPIRMRGTKALRREPRRPAQPRELAAAAARP